MIDRATLRWNGWGPRDAPDPTAGRDDLWPKLAGALGMPSLLVTPARRAEEITFPAPTLSEQALGALAAIVGRENVRTDGPTRLAHARGRSYHDLLHLRAGAGIALPDAVLYPTGAEEIVRILKMAEEERWAIIPFGGGTSVVGGVTASAPEAFTAVLTLDLAHMNRILAIDPVAMTATIEAGLDGPALEERLQAEDLTLGHYPQSFEFSTLGGWVAARGAGQQSTRYGKAEKWLVSARLVTPRGIWRTEDAPASAAGPRLGDLVVGSEGTLGVITDATVKIHPRPKVKDYRGYLFRDCEAGAAAIRAIVQAEIPAAMLRLSDGDETYFFQAFAARPAPPSMIRNLINSYLAYRGFADRPCLLLVGHEGEAAPVRSARRAASGIIKRMGGLSIGTAPGTRWYHGRFAAPYLRDPMLDHGLGLDTLETATSWSKIDGLYHAVRTALIDAMRKEAPAKDAHGVVLAHISHAYPDGASLYFTFIFPRDVTRDIDQWWAIKRAASDAIIAAGGTISHHHGVGEDHRPWIEAEKGPLWVETMRAVKRTLDPSGILNPGKLLP